MVARAFLSLAGLGLIVGANGAAAAKPLRLAPSSGWELREYDDKCRMIRTFGEGEDALTLWIDKGGPGPAVNLTLVGRPVRSPYGAYIRVGFAPGEQVDRNFITATSSKGRPVLGLFGVQPVSLLEVPAKDAATPETEDEGEGEGEESVDLTQSAASAFASEATLKRRYADITALELSGAVIDPVTVELDRVLPMANDLMACAAALTARLSQDFRAGGGMGNSPKPVDAEIWAKKIKKATRDIWRKPNSKVPSPCG